MKPSTLSCDAVIEMLPLHVGGDLEEASHHAVVRHLAGCGSCRVAEARAATARRALRDGFEAEVRGGGPALWPGVRAALVRDGLLAPRSAPSIGPQPAGAVLRGPWKRVAAGFAAAAGVALLVVPTLRERHVTPPADLVQGELPAVEVQVGGQPVLADAAAGLAPAAPRQDGLVRIRDGGDLLRAQLGPASDSGNRLILDSPVR